MKTVIVTLALFCALFCSVNTASARGIIVYSNGEKIEVVKNLPDDALVNNEHVNLGVMYKQFSIFWIPMWNYGKTKFVLIDDAKKTYYDLTSEEVEMLKNDFNVDIPSVPTIGFWNKIGGKIIWGAVILAVIITAWTSRKDDKEAEIPK
ncbi:MAG: hypothetical protein FWF52_03880 [Candidatus Azobacteroides sp.]|nr:hypothetical protein [Candidatus Azobacteroides sp.]